MRNIADDHRMHCEGSAIQTAVFIFLQRKTMSAIAERRVHRMWFVVSGEMQENTVARLSSGVCRRLFLSPGLRFRRVGQLCATIKMWVKCLADSRTTEGVFLSQFGIIFRIYEQVDVPNATNATQIVDQPVSACPHAQIQSLSIVRMSILRLDASASKISCWTIGSSVWQWATVSESIRCGWQRWCHFWVFFLYLSYFYRPQTGSDRRSTTTKDQVKEVVQAPSQGAMPPLFIVNSLYECIENAQSPSIKHTFFSIFLVRLTKCHNIAL